MSKCYAVNRSAAWVAGALLLTATFILPTAQAAEERVMVFRTDEAGMMEGMPGGMPPELCRELAGGPSGPGHHGPAMGHGPHWGHGMDGPGPLWGVELATLTPTLGHYFGTDQGVLVVHGVAALKLLDGDVLRAIGARPVQDEQHARRILHSYAPGEKIAFEVLRDRKAVHLEAELPPLAEPMPPRDIQGMVKPES